LIDEINIKQANREAMRRALIELLRKINEDDVHSILVDGNDNYIFDELKKQPVFII
jgi:ribonuclease HII